MPVGGLPAYPTIQSVTNLVRSWTQDDMAGATGTLGEGQIFVDNTSISVTLSNFFNSALSTLCRKLRINSGPMLIFDGVNILGIPPLQSPTQGQAPDPSVQVSIGFTGYFNGVTMNSQFALPSNVLVVERVWERINGSNDDFRLMSQPSQGLSSRYQDVYNRWWEWRQDSIVMPGSINTMDLRIRYKGTLVPLYGKGIDTSQTYIPILDSTNCLAGLILVQIAGRQGAGVTVSPIALDWAKTEISDFLNQWVLRDQGINYPVTPFSGASGDQDTGTGWQ